MSSKMAWVMYYPVAAAGTYFLGRNILLKGTSFAIDYLLNSNADPDIKDVHTVQTIKSMLLTYENLSETHPAYESMQTVKRALNELKDVIDRARLRLSVHESGWVTRWRTFDARSDNNVIEKKAHELMSYLDIFTKLIRCPEPMPLLTLTNSVKNHKHKKDYQYTSYSDGVDNDEDIVPIEDAYMLD